MQTLTKPETTLKELLEDMGYLVKFFSDKAHEDANCIYMQMPVLSYSLDFACPKRKIAIEVDGEFWHGSISTSLTANQLQRKIEDFTRTENLKDQGWTLFRVPANSLNHTRLQQRLIKYLESLMTKSGPSTIVSEAC